MADPYTAHTQHGDESKLKSAVQFIERGMHDKALPIFKELARHNKTVAIHQYNYGNALRMVGRLRDAAQFYAAAHKLDPNHVDAAMNLALIYCEQGRHSEALILARGVLTRHPANPIAALILNLAVDMGAIDDSARDVLAQVVAALESGCVCTNQTDAARVTFALGIVYILLDRRDDAVATLRRALEYPEIAAHAVNRLLQVQSEICLWTDIQTLRDRLKDQARNRPATVGMFDLLKFDEPEIIRQVAMVKTPKPPGQPFRPQRPRGNKIRIGYLSPDFRDHPTSYLIAELPELHDRSAFDVQLFSYGAADDSAIRQRIASAADRFIDLHGRSSQEIAHAIHAARVDILVDLAPFIGTGRMEIAALRPAPIQVNWLGYPGTTGAPHMDYLIGDHQIIPRGYEEFYSEAVVRLPVTYQSTDRKRTVAVAKSRAEHGLPDTGRILAAFHQGWKILPEMFDVWCRLLVNHPDTVLWFIAIRPEARQNLCREAEARGISSSRLVFGERLPNAEHLTRYECADLLLDTFPCGAHTTLSDALWQGCPAVTMSGRSFQARVGASLLNAANLPQMVTTSVEEYEIKLNQLLSDPGALPDLRVRLRTQREHIPLFDTPRFVRELESAYCIMAERARAGLPPKAFDVPLGG